MLRKWIQSGATSKPADTTADTSDTNVVQPPRTRTPGKSPAHHSNKKKAASSTADKENGGTMTRHGPSTSTPKRPLVMRRRSPRGLRACVHVSVCMCCSVTTCPLFPGHAEAVNSAGDTDAAGTPAKRARIADAEDESACGSRGSEASGAVAVRAGETSTMLSPLETGTSETAGNSDTGTSDTMTLEQRTMGASWYAVLAGEFEKSYFQQVSCGRWIALLLR